MAELSKMVRDGSNSLEQVLRGDQNFRPIMLDYVTKRDGEEGAKAVTTVLDLARNRAVSARDTMVNKETKVAHESGDLVSPRKGRDTSNDDNIAQQGSLRALIEAVCAPSVAARYKLTGQLPRSPKAVLQLSQHMLTTYDTEGAPPSEVAVDFPALFEKLRPVAKALEDHLAQLGQEERELELAVVEKQEAMGVFNAEFREYAGLVSMFLESAGQDDLARRLRPSRTRPGQTHDVATGGTGEVPEPAADDAA